MPASAVPVRSSKRPVQVLQRCRCRCGWVSSHPLRITASLPQPGQRTPSGQRCWRTSAKHLASSSKAERLTRSMAAMMAEAPRTSPSATPTLAFRPDHPQPRAPYRPHHPERRQEPRVLGGSSEPPWTTPSYGQHLSSMLAELAGGTHIAVEGNPGDAQLLAELGDAGIPAGHCHLGEADLCLAEAELPATLATSGSRRLEASHGALPDQLALELGQGREDAEDQPAAGGRGVELGALTSQDAQADAAVAEILHRVDEMSQVTAEPVELPDHEDIALAQRLEARRKPRPVVTLSGGLVLIDVVWLHGGFDQRIPL